MRYWDNGKLIDGENICPKCGGKLEICFGEDNGNCFSPDEINKYTERICLTCKWYQISYDRG